MVSAGLLQSVLKVRVKRGAELSTDLHRVVCNFHREKLPGPTQRCRTGRSYRIKREALADKDVRNTFAESVSSLPEISRNAQGTRRWSGDCSKQLVLNLLLGYADRNDSVWRIMAKT